MSRSYIVKAVCDSNGAIEYEDEYDNLREANEVCWHLAGGRGTSVYLFKKTPKRMTQIQHWKGRSE